MKDYSRCRACLLAAVVSATVAGCQSSAENPVIFGQKTTLGVSIGQSADTQTPELTVGYKDANVAYLPTVARDANGNVTKLGGQISGNGGEFGETYSVLGQFESASGTETGNPSVGLGKFFATGNAALKLAAGFACALADGRDQAHCHRPGS